MTKFLFSFDFDETLTDGHIFDTSQLTSPEAMKCPERMSAFLREALAEGHKIAIVTRNKRENVEIGLRLLGIEPGNVIIVTDSDVSFPDPSHYGKAKHIEKALAEAGSGFTPVLVDDDERNVALAPGGLGVRVWQTITGTEPPQEVAEAHVNTLQRILQEPANAAQLCEEHATFLQGRDLETGQRLIFAR